MLRVLAQIFSAIFHPLFMLTYMLILLLLINPYLFGVNHIRASSLLIILVFLSTVIIPAFGVLLMKGLGFIESLEMKDKQERIAPYIMTGIFYLWLLINLINNPDIPSAYSTFVLGATIALFLAFIINIFSKISMHTVGVGGLVGMVIITMLQYSYGSFAINLPLFGYVQVSMTTLLMTVILISGIVGSSRMYLQAHQPDEIYGGFLVGLFAQFAAAYFLFPA